MSWAISYEVNKHDVTDDAEARLNDWLENVVKDYSDEAKEQIVLAMLATMNLIDTGAVGDPDGTYAISIAGHANPEHKKTEGWGNDYISVAVYQKVEGQ